MFALQNYIFGAKTLRNVKYILGIWIISIYLQTIHNINFAKIY